MSKNIYMIIDGEIIETFKNVSKVTYENKTLSFYIEETDYNFDEVQAEIVFAPDDVTITKDNYKNYLLTKELTQQDQEIETLKQAITELTMIINEGR